MVAHPNSLRLHSFHIYVCARMYVHTHIYIFIYIYIYIFTTCIPKTKGSATLIGEKEDNQLQM